MSVDVLTHMRSEPFRAIVRGMSDIQTERAKEAWAPSLYYLNHLQHIKPLYDTMVKPFVLFFYCSHNT